MARRAHLSARIMAKTAAAIPANLNDVSSLCSLRRKLADLVGADHFKLRGAVRRVNLNFAGSIWGATFQSLSRSMYCGAPVIHFVVITYFSGSG